MLWIVYILPPLALTVLYFLYEPVEWWWYAVLAAILDAALYGCHRFFLWWHNKSTEYHGSYASYVIYYEPWDELRSRQVPVRDEKGNVVRYRTEYYIVYHPAEYYMAFNTGDSCAISGSLYNYYARLWGTPSVFHDMHRNYHTQDGDAYSHDWNGYESDCVMRTEKKSYINPLKHSNSIFRYKSVSAQEARELDLHDYPKVKDWNQEAILGGEVSDEAQHRFRYLNATLGSVYEIRIFVLIFDASCHKADVAERQRAYWHGGAKNEFVICLGLRGNKTVEWCHTFSWMDKPDLGVAVEAYFLQNTSLNLMHFSNWFADNIGLWKRKEFSDFNYLELKLSRTQQFLMLAIACGLCYLGYYIIENSHNSYQSSSYQYENNYDYTPDNGY